MEGGGTSNADQVREVVLMSECDRKGRWPLGRTAFDESYGITAEQPRHFGYGFGRTLLTVISSTRKKVTNLA